MAQNVTPGYVHYCQLIKTFSRRFNLVLVIILLIVSSATAQLPSTMITSGFYNFTLPYNNFQDYSTATGIGGDGFCTTGGSPFDYIDYQNVVETMHNTGGQCITIAFQPSSLMICGTDSLVIYDGPTPFSPVLATYTNMVAASNPSLLTTSPYVTFRFVATATSHAKGWGINFSNGACPATPPNDDCAGAIPLVVGSTCVTTSGSTLGAHQSSQPANCTALTSNNDDVWYSFVANNSSMSVTVNGTNNMDPVVQVYSGSCGALTTITCQNSTSGINTNETVNLSSLTSGNTYFIRVYDVNTGVGQNAINYTYTICVVGSAPQDCAGATLVNSFFTITATANDYGIQEYNPTTFGCIIGGEHRSLWYKMHVTSPGDIAFTLTPTAGQDIDFAIWGPYSSSSCSNITGGPLRCTWAANNGLQSGLRNSALDVSEGAACCGADPWGSNGWLSTIYGANAGDWYIFLIDGWTSFNGSNLSLTWTGTAILPVVISEFTGSSFDYYNQLNWTTASELNTSYFALERSSDGASFDSIGFVSGAGNSITTKNYEYMDRKPLEGENYYRLKQVDLNGDISYTNVVVLKNYGAGITIEGVYPNPTSGLTSLDLTSFEDADIEVKVTDALGRIIYANTTHVLQQRTVLSFDLSNYPPGIYLVHCRNTQKQVSLVSKLVKM